MRAVQLDDLQPQSAVHVRTALAGQHVLHIYHLLLLTHSIQTAYQAAYCERQRVQRGRQRQVGLVELLGVRVGCVLRVRDSRVVIRVLAGVDDVPQYAEVVQSVAMSGQV